MPKLLTILIALAACALAGSSMAAEGVKLTYVVGIYLDEKGAPLRQPEGLACNDKSGVVVGDSRTGRLLRYTVDGRDVKPTGAMQAPQLTAPIRVELSSRDEALALDGRQRRIVRFDAKGEFKGYVSPEGVPDPATIVARSFKLDRADSIYLLDVFSARVLVLDRDGKYQRHVPFPADYGFFSDLAVDGKGAIYLIDSVRAALWVAAKDAKAFVPVAKPFRGHVSFPTSLTVDGRGVLFIVDESGGGIVLVAQDGTVLGRQLAMGWKEGLLYFPSQLCLNPKGQVFIADRGNSRVQVYAIVR